MEKNTNQLPTQTVSLPAAAPEHIVALTPKAYQILSAHVQRAEERGLSARFSYWLETCLTKGIESTQRPWDDRDLLKAAKQAIKNAAANKGLEVQQ
jgi:hypothetical protein